MVPMSKAKGSLHLHFQTLPKDPFLVALGVTKISIGKTTSVNRSTRLLHASIISATAWTELFLTESGSAERSAIARKPWLSSPGWSM